ncbi:G-type lectin S-receptor-like serine/threonine-protein kinase SD2-5 [Cucurbita moschata]|uniref:Receptor-like serine/threonine-protein kinase n=1 Tax=Cucurbita moschata TaxID=3662 RepID=A0A6J1G9X7_CUCMO|nr:G-type lectin S-receptor-like serine/threonine-protein kinase SD2-5 [Cucurbita moschata]
MGLFKIASFFFFFVFLIQSHIDIVKCQEIDKLNPGFKASASELNHTNGVFLLSKASIFALGFYAGANDGTFSLGITHILSSRVIWTANRDFPVNDSALFVFDETGDTYLDQFGPNSAPIWSTETARHGVVSMQLLDSGNLVLRSKNGSFVWQSFHFPTNTLLPGQVFWEGMKLESYSNDNNLSSFLEFKQGDLVLSAGYQNPQVYWALSNDGRKIKRAAAGSGSGNGGDGYVLFAIMESNSWNFFGKNGELLWGFKFFWQSNWKDRWVSVLNTDGSIAFHNLESGKSAPPEPIRIPAESCGVPEPCDPLFICYFDNRCQCASTILDDKFNCKFPSISCNGRSNSTELLYLGKNLDYFALRFSIPALNSDLNNCKAACASNCSCNVMFFEPNSGDCFFFDEIGSLQRSDEGSNGYISYMKIELPINSNNNETTPTPTPNRRKHIVLMSILIAAMALSFMGLLCFLFYRRKVKELLSSIEDATEEDKFLEEVSSGPMRFSYRQLRRATRNFSTKIGHGGFGSVYLGDLGDGTRLAVKKLEKIGQGGREFRAEVSLIGGIHHVNLVKLKGFCSENLHRLLVYEYMSNGSLDKWIFNGKEDGFLDWETRFNIALGTARALAYLHQECESKIIHCDIKPENVLLDDNFTPKLSDFGMAKLVNREQSNIFTQLRGTRGYMAPEWITNLAISDKSDVYSYGMVLLEIVANRKCYDADQSPESAHLPSYAARMVAEKKGRWVLDPRVAATVTEEDWRVEAVVEVAVWCVQEEASLRPPMRKVVQMLEGVCPVPRPPSAAEMGRSFSWSSGGGGTVMSLGLNGCFSEVRLSDVRLSGPR